MSSENVQQLRRFVDAFNGRDVDAFVAYCDPSVEFHSAFAAVGGEVYHGHDGLRRYHRDMEDAWGSEIRVEPQAYFDLGEHTLAFYLLHGRGRSSQVEVAMPVALIMKWRGGLIIYSKGYAHREDALSELGVSEGELAQIAP